MLVVVVEKTAEGISTHYELERLRRMQLWSANIEAKAENLLLHVIGKAAFARMLETGYVEIPSKRYSGIYRIHQDAQRGVQLVKADAPLIPIATICISTLPGEYLPAADQLVTLYMIAKYDEERLHTTGVVSWRNF